MAYFFGLEILGVFGICIVFSFLILCVYKLWNRLEKFKTGFTGAIAHLNEATSGSVPINEEEQILLRAVIDRDFDGKIVVSESLPDKVVASQVIGPLLVPAIQPPGLQGHLREYFFEVNSL